MFVSRKAIPRRSFLRGAGTALALPLLDSMFPAFGADAPGATPRLGFIYIGNGIVHANWVPKTTGPDFELTPNLLPLAKVRELLAAREPFYRQADLIIDTSAMSIEGIIAEIKDRVRHACC